MEMEMEMETEMEMRIMPGGKRALEEHKVWSFGAGAVAYQKFRTKAGEGMPAVVTGHRGMRASATSTAPVPAERTKARMRWLGPWRCAYNY